MRPLLAVRRHMLLEVALGAGPVLAKLAGKFPLHLRHVPLHVARQQVPLRRRVVAVFAGVHLSRLLRLLVVLQSLEGKNSYVK